jgi:hypothetical protein
MGSLLNQERFQQDDIPTRLNYLAAHLNQIQLLTMPGTTILPGIVGSSVRSIAFDSSEQIVSLMRESRYYIEWIVPHLIDIDQAAELVDMGRVLTRWLFDWEKIWTDTDSRNEVAQIAGSLSERILEMPELSQTSYG